MRKYRLLSLILSIVLVMNLCIPFAHAVEVKNMTNVGTELEDGYRFLVHGEEDSNKRFNIFIDTKTGEGQFAVVYLDEPDYVHEYFFSVEDLDGLAPNREWGDIEAFCFGQKSEWKELYVPAAVDCVEYPDDVMAHDGEVAPLAAAAADTDAIEYFEGWLENKYERENSGKMIGHKTQNGTTMYLKSAFQIYVYRNQSYIIATTISVAGFITSVLGWILDATKLSFFGALVGAGGLFTAGSSVHEYKLRANWFKYATLGTGKGYPYGMVDKFVYYTGYQYTETGTCNVDEASIDISYVPSSTVYYDDIQIYDAAFEEYAQIGWQDGNF